MRSFKDLIRISEDNIEELVPQGGVLLLMACLRQGEGLEASLASLERTARWFGGDLRVCYGLDDILSYLMDRFHFNQVPTFLLIRQGELLAARSGAARADELIGFVREGGRMAAREA